jgi:hypothetical protein
MQNFSFRTLLSPVLSPVFSPVRTKSLVVVRAARPIGLWRVALQALMVVGLLASSFSAVAASAATGTAGLTPMEMSPGQVRQWVRQTMIEVKPALHATVDGVVPSTLQTLVAEGKLTPPMAAKFAQIYIAGQAPADMPEIAQMLQMSPKARTDYSLQRLQQEGLLSGQEVQLFNTLRNADDAEVRALAVSALESGSYGLLATGILQTVVDLTAIDTTQDYETCDAAASSLRAQGWLGNALRWIGGLAKSVLSGALDGALYGLLFGGSKGALIGGVLGGIAGGVKYVADSTGNGFMPGPNGEDCTGWPSRGFPSF